MLEELRAKCKKSLRKQMIISAVIAIVLLVAPLMAPLRFLMGPKEMTDIANLEKYEGKYVSYEIEYAFDYYMESYSYNSDTGRRTSTNSYGYIVYDWDANACFAVEIASKHDKDMNDIMDATWNGTEIEKTVVAEGTLKELKGDDLKYFKESAAYYEDIPGFENSVKYYVIDYNRINNVPLGIVALCYFGIMICAIFFIIALVKALTHKADKRVKKFLEANISVREDQIDNDLRTATKIGSNLWAGQLFTIYIASANIHILDNRNIVWAYYYSRSGRNSVSQVRTYNKDKKMVAINLSANLSQALLEEYVAKQPQMIVGYDRDLDKQYSKDFEGFLNLRYYAAKKQSEENTADYNTEFASTDYSGMDE